MFFNKTEDEIELEEFSAAYLRKKIKSMKGIKTSPKSIASSILRMLPFFNKFMDSVDGSGSAITHMVQVAGHVSDSTASASTGFHVIKLVTSILDFIYIPCIYLGAYITKQESPITLSRNARFLYSAVILGLTITAIAYPPAAPIIALVTSIAALALSVITLAKLYYKRYELKDQLAEIEKKIESKKNVINYLIDDLENLETKAKKAKKEGKVEEYTSLEEDIRNARKEIKADLNTLQKLYNEQEECKQKIEKLGTMAVVDRAVGITFASIAFIGAAFCLFLPPVGFGILAATASLALAYVIGRVTYPLLKSLGKKIINAVTKKTESDEGDNDTEGEKDDLTESEFETSDRKVKQDMPGIKKIAERLKETVADEPIIRPTLQPKDSDQVSPSKSTGLEKKKEEDELLKETERPPM
ncbi:MULTISPECIES: hypothetical protein [Legionella]|uniref:Coiled-coil protein n=1 Tax=Legionella resiliens TaxID=2905958 RepID=A0ABS8X349_9GAMM|nr:MULTISPECIES: hypothetical protein [unclassified Legionella]MCE0722175.1 hypothetical protein [Legionella sp. 9fVS26]MCE3531329.1 hypothetical protein [Legionella sp. 8cVS16]QLZ67342.1 hypothetical protein FOLKNPGA_00107 [Legionella sp. PC1000]